MPRPFHPPPPRSHHEHALRRRGQHRFRAGLSRIPQRQRRAAPATAPERLLRQPDPEEGRRVRGPRRVLGTRGAVAPRRRPLADAVPEGHAGAGGRPHREGRVGRRRRQRAHHLQDRGPAHWHSAVPPPGCDPQRQDAGTRGGSTAAEGNQGDEGAEGNQGQGLIPPQGAAVATVRRPPCTSYPQGIAPGCSTEFQPPSRNDAPAAPAFAVRSYLLRQRIARRSQSGVYADRLPCCRHPLARPSWGPSDEPHTSKEASCACSCARSRPRARTSPVYWARANAATAATAVRVSS
mmetsp:Transcript_21038/g.81340  ORF Transcript_21038/g.81340 Transcript_21038/m.81340 type:complete len:293 (+) Transcript_21038:588-1466(+)